MLQYHIVTLAKEGLDQVLDGMSDLDSAQHTALRNSVAICNVDGSIDDECAPLTMTIKVRWLRSVLRLAVLCRARRGGLWTGSAPAMAGGESLLGKMSTAVTPPPSIRCFERSHACMPMASMTSFCDGRAR